MEGRAGPKRLKRAVGTLARGAPVKDPEAVLVDALFLQEHPGWSWRDLQETPYEVIEVMRMLGKATSDVAKAQVRKHGK